MYRYALVSPPIIICQIKSSDEKISYNIADFLHPKAKAMLSGQSLTMPRLMSLFCHNTLLLQLNIVLFNKQKMPMRLLRSLKKQLWYNVKVLSVKF